MHRCVLTAATATVTVMLLTPVSAQPPSAPTAKPAPCREDAGLALAPGFCATVFADKLGHVRHLAVTPDGTVYVNSWSGPYYQNDTPPPEGFLIALKDTKGDGHADKAQRFGGTPGQGARGGTGIRVYKDGLFAEANDRIIRYQLKPGELAPTSEPVAVVSGLPVGGDHPMLAFSISANGAMYVNVGSATNACQAENRMLHSAGLQPCRELETRGGTWRYDANRTDQHFSPAERFVTGLRNGEGISFDASGRVYATQHGRDQLFENWPKLYTPAQGHILPAEELVIEQRGDDFGWPVCYFDNQQQKLVLAPEYGGDGHRIGVCAQKKAPVAVFPAHWAPNDMLIYNGEQFPIAYRGGAFIAFHGSWNRAPAPQGGYNIVFQPLSDGKAAGPFVVFADGFAGPRKDPSGALHRPTGLALGPDGALYIADDKGGRVWRMTYSGSPDAAVEAAPAPAGQAQTASAQAAPPEGIHPNAGDDLAGLQPPPAISKAQLRRGAQIFQGQVDNGTCAGCHGSDGRGTPTGANLTDANHQWSDGSLLSIQQIITAGVAHPRSHTGAMPPGGGMRLSQADLRDVAAYVWALGQRPQGHAAD